MSGTARVVRSLLDALRNAGHGDEVSTLEREFEARDWQVDIGDQLRLLERLQTISSTPKPPPDPAPPERVALRSTPPIGPASPLPTPSELFQPFYAFAPWVATLPDDWRFVLAVHGLFTVDTVPQLSGVLTRIFVDHLGFEPSPIDETHRLGGQRTFTEVRAVARYEDFFVMAVASMYAGYHTSSFEAVFQLHPRCIIVAIERGSRIRVVTRRVVTGPKPIGQRILRGRGHRAFPDDDVFVWAARLAGLEPRNRDDGRALAQRADDLLSKPVADLLRDWVSAPIDPRSIPGPSWEGSARDELDRFLQVDASTRIVYGLEAELQSSFPWSTRDNRVELRCGGYRVVEIEADTDHAEAHAHTLSATVELDLELRVSIEEAPTSSTRFRLPVAITVPDKHGVFVIHGSRFTFVPGAHQRTPDPNEETSTTTDEFEAEEAVDFEGSSVPSEPDPAEEDFDADAEADVYAGQGLVPLLRWAVGRHLRALGVRFSKANANRLQTPTDVRAWLGGSCDARSRLQLTARTVLLRYLEPVLAGQLRTIAVDPFSSPPAWACLELARDLEPGRAYPIAGARLGPGGGLFAPVIDAKGQLRLSAESPPDSHNNPRVTSDGEDSGSALWIATPLERFGSLPIGAIGRPLDVACFGMRWVCNVFEDSEPATILRIAPESLALPRRRHRWTLDLPRQPDVDGPPSVVVEPGQYLEPGAPVAQFDDPWTDAPAGTHEMVLVGREILEQKKTDHARLLERQANRKANGEPPRPASRPEDAPEPKPERSIIRCPSAARGRVEQVQVVPVVDRRGIVTRYRITLDTSFSLQPAHAVLGDGRLVRLQICGKEDLPWKPDGSQIADAILSSDEAAWSPSDRWPSDVLWVDGRTGEPMSGTISLQTITILPAEPTRLPDPCLQYRAIDGWGLPRTPSDPHISMQTLRRTIAEHPEAAESIHAVLRDVHGQPPSASSIFELCRASRVAPPAYIPRDWQPVEVTDAAPSTYDPVRTTIHRSSRAPYTAEQGPWHWACDCGVLTEAKRAQISCVTCKTTVKRRWVGTRPAVISLPFPVLHPWRKRLVGALLGLLGDEFARVTKQHDCSPLFEATRAALADPSRNLVTRLARCSDRKVQVQLAAELAALESASSRGLELDDLWISELDVLSPRLLFDGYRSGAPDLLASPLTRAYRRIQGIAQIEYGTNTTLRQAVWVELQRGVDDLFGDLEETMAPSVGTLADMWRRIWPTTASGRLQVSVPGLFERCTARELRSSAVAQLLASSLPSTDSSWELGILTAEGVEPLPILPSVSGTPVDAGARNERAAWSRCSGPLLVPLAALCFGIDERPSIVAALGALPRAAAFDGVARIGPLVLRELLLRARPPQGRPSALLDMLETTGPLFLPHDRVEAMAEVETRLEPAIPGNEVGALLVRVALARVLTGFWHGRPTVQCPHPWVWSAHADDVPNRFRRAIPPFSSKAWHAWPGFQLMTNPVAAALGGWAWDTTVGYQQWFGLPGLELPLAVDLTVPTTIDEPHDTVVPPMVAPPSPLDPMARVLTVSLGQWIHHHAPRQDHANR